MERVALTFDDGPAEWTEPILDLLSEHSARATFFVIGSAAAKRADLVRRMHADGHEVGNHTWSHPRLARDCYDDRVREELGRTNTLLAEIVGHPPRRFRAPHYDVNERVLAIASGLGLIHTHGDVTPPDWDDRCTAPYIAAFVLQQARPSVVIGLHDGISRKDQAQRGRQATVDAIAAILPRLSERGFQCVTASEILSEP
ncbi:hypothetical protein BH18ACT13_BH18ACT13_10100 [soil metagenome]